MRVAVLALILVAGCGGSPTVTTTADALPATAPAPFCSYDLSAPEDASGDLSYNSRPPHTDCIPPDRGAVFSLGFARADWWLQLDAVRSAFAVGQPVRFESTDQAALLALDCWTWTGEFIVMQDDATGWSVFVDATCSNLNGLRIAGQWQGTF